MCLINFNIRKFVRDMKTIQVTEEILTKLSHSGLKSETYNDIIVTYEKMYFEQLSDE